MLLSSQLTGLLPIAMNPHLGDWAGLAFFVGFLFILVRFNGMIEEPGSDSKSQASDADGAASNSPGASGKGDAG